MKKSILVLILVFFIAMSSYAFGAGELIFNPDNDNLTIVGCPSYHKNFPALQDEGFRVIRSGSVTESIQLLESERADFAIIGRKLKPDEPQFLDLKLRDGYLFLNEEGSSITESEMSSFDFYTDLDRGEIAATFPEISEDNLIYEKDPYTKTGKGIVVTSYENTDYSNANPVYIYDGFGRRVENSQRPTLIFSDKNDINRAKEIKELIEDSL